MSKLNILLVLLFSSLMTKSQIVIDNNAPYDNPTWLVDNILLGGGVVAFNHAYQGDVAQIGWFNAINTNLGIDSGIVMCTGDIYALDPINNGLGFTPPMPAITDPDLLNVAQSVPGMIGQSFTVSSVNDIAILEFDFIPTSDSLNFKYAFGSQEYFFYENTQYNDVFGFFLSGPGITGPYYAPPLILTAPPTPNPFGSINLAVVPNTVPPLPITISSINSATPINQQYFVDNSYITSNPFADLDTIADADGFTTVLTASAVVQCGETYHIRLAIADGTDGGLSSYVWLEAGSFYSPPLSIADDLGIDSTIMSIPCNSTVTLTASGGVGATYQWFDSTSTVFSTNSSVIVGEGVYIVSADISGCAVLSDTLRVIEGDSPNFYLGADTIIACNSSYLLTPNVLGGTPPYVYLWSNGSNLSSQTLGEGDYDLIISDLFGCGDTSSISITYDPPPVVDLGSDYTIACNTTTTLIPNIVGGTQPYSYAWNDGSINSSLVISEGNYSLTVSDFWNCSDWDDVDISVDIPGTVTLTGGGSICDNGTTVIMDFDFNGLLPWNLEFTNGLSNQTIQGITNSNYLLTTSNEGIYDVIVASDVNDCLANIVGTAQVIVHPLPIANISPIESFIYEGETIELEVGDYEMYQWYNAEGLDLDTLSTLTVSDSGTFYVWVKDVNGCEDVSDIAIVHTQPRTNLFIPNAFTPNSDDHNELFVIRGVSVKTFNIQIFNRWGELMFMSESIDKSWDGTFDNKKVQEGTYYYNIKVLGDDNRILELSGYVNIIY
jgi:gliding motility-associated-like protein